MCYSDLVLCLHVAKLHDHGKINSITITPNPPVKGQKLNITVNIAIGKYFQWVGVGCSSSLPTMLYKCCYYVQIMLIKIHNHRCIY